MPASPWYGDERLTLAEAVHAYTLGAANAAGWDRVIGSLGAGKLADLVVVDRDLFALSDAEVAAGAIAQAQALMTIVGGEIVFSRSV